MSMESSMNSSSMNILSPQINVHIGQIHARLQRIVVINALEGTGLDGLNVVRGITDETSGRSASDRVQLLATESCVWVSVLVEEPIANTSPEELLGQDAEEGRTSQGTSDMSLEGTAHSQVHILVAHIQRLQLSHARGSDQVQEVLEGVRALQSAELPEVVVAGQSVVTVTLNVQSLQVHSEGLILTEQEVLHLRINVDVCVLFGLCDHTAVQVIELGFYDHGAVQPIAEPEAVGTGTVLRKKAERIRELSLVTTL